MLRAEAELTPGRFSTLEARDLSTNELVPHPRAAPAQRRGEGGLRARALGDWKRDVQMFRAALGPQSSRSTSTTASTPRRSGRRRRALSRLVPAAAARARRRCTSWTRCCWRRRSRWWCGRSAGTGGAAGRHRLLPGSTAPASAWTGGAFLRYVWFAPRAAGGCFLHRGVRPRAGAAGGGGGAARVPGAVARRWGACRRCTGPGGERRAPREHLRSSRPWAGPARAVLVTGLQARGLGAWGRVPPEHEQAHGDCLADIVGPRRCREPGPPEQITLEEMRAQCEHDVEVARAEGDAVLAAPPAVVLLAPPAYGPISRRRWWCRCCSPA